MILVYDFDESGRKIKEIIWKKCIMIVLFVLLIVHIHHHAMHGAHGSMPDFFTCVLIPSEE